MTNNIVTVGQAQEIALNADRASEPCTLVVFGASGDLTRRKLMPAIFRLARRGLLSSDFRLIGYARSIMTDDEFREQMRQAVMRDAGIGAEQAWPAFAANLSYITAECNSDDLTGYAELKRKLKQAERETSASGRLLYYLAIPPMLITPILRHLSDMGLAGQTYQPAAADWARIIIEKPFGRDLTSARALNDFITQRFDENDIYRIDHFLGKEIVQNLFTLRFANNIFEPVWNHNYIRQVQITAAETLGMEGRGSYFESAGILRDMIQNHLLQLCALVAIEPPAEWTASAVRDEKVKLLRAIRKIKPLEVKRNTVRGQYLTGIVDGKRVSAYREEEGVAADSRVETYAALKLFINNARWAGVPFYLRSGKRLARRGTEIIIEFKPAPHTPWSLNGKADRLVRPNLLIVTVSPEEGITMRLEAKQPGQTMELQSIYLDYCHNDQRDTLEPLTAYEHLLLDSMRGDPTFFARADEVEAAWAIIDPILEGWEKEKKLFLPNYSAGSAGPIAADEMLARDGLQWYGLTDLEEGILGST